MSVIARLQGGPDIAKRLVEVPSVTRSSFTLDVGYGPLADQLKTIFPGLPVNDKSVLKQLESDSSIWERDCQIQNPLTRTILQVLSLRDDIWGPHSHFDSQLYPSLQFINDIQGANILAPPMQKPGAYVEGGNLFYSLLNKPGNLEERLAAIIGVTTVLWTKMYLDQIGHFTDRLLNEEISCMQQEKAVDYGDPNGMAKWRLTTRIIAEDLGVKIENLICLEHNLLVGSASTACLHIDLTIAPGPDNKVFVHSPSLVKEQLVKLGRDGQGCTEAALLTADQEITERNCAILKKHGFEVIPIAGYYGSLTGCPEHETHFLNGIFFRHRERHIFVTAAAQHTNQGSSFTPDASDLQALSLAFSEKMAEHRISVVYINFLRHLQGSGGVHCMTCEKRVITVYPLAVFPVENMRETIDTIVVFRAREKAEDIFQSISLFVDGRDVYRIEPNMLKKNGSLGLKFQVPLEGAKLSFRTDKGLIRSFQLLPGHPQEVIL